MQTSPAQNNGGPGLSQQQAHQPMFGQQPPPPPPAPEDCPGAAPAKAGAPDPPGVDTDPISKAPVELRLGLLVKIQVRPSATQSGRQ